MYIKNFRGKSKLSELKNRKKLARRLRKPITAMTDTIICENCKILQEMNYCKVLFESIKTQYQFLDEYLKFRRSGLETKRDLNDIWAEVRHSENSLKADRVLKQCPLLRKKFNNYLAYRDKVLKAYV